MIISFIVAASENNAIGGQNQLLWQLPNDLQYFKEKTKGHPIIMGRKTFESMGRALPHRRNIVITHQKDLSLPGCDVVSSIDDALKFAKQEPTDEIFIIGGGEIFREAMPLADRIYLTRVHANFGGDTFFPELSEQEWKEISRDPKKADDKNEYDYTFLVYERVKQ